MKYSTNDDFMEKVTTFDGTQAPRRDCRFIKGDFYVKNKQCFYINDMWYRINSNKIIFDHEIKEWVITEGAKSVYGIINITNYEEVEYGFFSKNNKKNLQIFHNGNIVLLFDITIIEGKRFIKEGLNDCYYFISDPNVPKTFTLKLKPRKDNFYTFPFNYGSEELIPEFTRTFNNDFKAPPLLSDNYHYIEHYTFGVEFETNKGAIPERFLKPNGLIACRDGSINGFEYTTIPLQGYKGIQNIKIVCDLLKKYCSCSTQESLHIHLGGYPKTIKALASLYRLGLLLQSEIYDMFPYYYVDTSQFKKKSYCNPLPTLGVSSSNANDIFNSLYMWLSNGNNFTRFPSGPHPMDKSGQQKWQISVRYVWLNMLPIIWGGRGTIEFRCHIPTVKAQKVINWLYITVAILDYAKKYTNTLTTNTLLSLEKVTLSQIIKEFYPPEIVTILDKYIKDRKKHYVNKNDYIGEEEITREEDEREIFNLIPFV